VFNGINMPKKDNPRWPIGNALETINVQVTGGPSGLTGPGRPRPPTWKRFRGLPVRAAFRSATASLSGWLASLPHSAGARLFAMNDAEAGWSGWTVTELRGGLARSYRDPRFDLLRPLRELDPQAPDPPAAQQAADPPKTVNRCPGSDWDDVHGWPRDGEG